MLIDTNHTLSVSEANQNFPRATRMAETSGQVVIFKNNRPKYILYDLDSSPQIEMSEEEKIDFVGNMRLKCLQRPIALYMQGMAFFIIVL